MCKYTDGTIIRMSNDQISRNRGLTTLLASLGQATRAVTQAKAEVAVKKTCQNGSRNSAHANSYHQHESNYTSQLHHTGDSSTEEEHSMGDSSGGHPGHRQSTIATRVRRKRHSRESEQSEPLSPEQHSTVQHHYHDFVGAAPMKTSSAEAANQSKKSKGGIAFPFPSVLHAMLERSDHEGFDDIVSWQPHGRAFIVHSPTRFVNEIMPLFFRQTRFASFQRQLSLYGFLRLTRKGSDHGAYYHELFVRGRADLCQLMQRTRIKGSWVRQSSSPDTEPDFASMPPAPKSSSAAMPKLPPRRSTASASKATAEKSSRTVATTGVAPLSGFSILPQNPTSYHSATGFGWTNSSLQSNKTDLSTMVPLNLPSKPFASPRRQQSDLSYHLPMQQYFEPPLPSFVDPQQQASLTSFLHDVGLDSDDELRAELSQYDTEPLPWNSPSNLTDL
mmetsp:Transcript_20123/g.38154  ORF Transcript_20123/g.38154 Transcript_20123/m.38154 type:complete len:446 (+) Transcript_20123:112-1449(+)